jgi:hypothetical protein
MRKVIETYAGSLQAERRNLYGVIVPFKQSRASERLVNPRRKAKCKKFMQVILANCVV